MKKIISLLFVVFVVSQTTLGQKYFTRTGITEFQASVETFEAVEATNKSTTAILKAETGDVAAQLFISAFKFDIALMQEHFNENYMDSDEFPKATFKGKLTNFSMKELSKGKTFELKGTLTIKGKSKKISTNAKVSLEKKKIKLLTSFSVKPEDFGIEIPSLVRKKVAKNIKINVNYALSEKK